jgi:diguanylate cyclase (GGDEF)-like protein
MFSLSSDLMRVDPLTGCSNFLGFIEACLKPDSSAEGMPSAMKVARDRYRISALPFSAVLFVSLNDMRSINETRGYAYGDSAIHWAAILLREETNRPVYRFGVEFAVMLQLENDQNHILLLDRIVERIDREAKLLGFPGAPADIALIFNDQSSTSLDSLLMQMGEAMVRIKDCENAHQMVFHASDFRIPAWSPNTWMPAGHSDISYTVRWITRASICHVIEIAKSLDTAQQDAFTDAISGLPNMKAAYLKVEQVLQQARANHKIFAMLFIDADNFRVFNNEISYAAGDQMIRALCAILKNHLRPSDFIARYRNGDEFIVILPDTSGEGAKIVGERFRLAVKEASRAWRFPITLSIGIATYPSCGAGGGVGGGETLESLFEQAEAANKRAKQQGKDQVVLAGE